VQDELTVVKSGWERLIASAGRLRKRVAQVVKSTYKRTRWLRCIGRPVMIRAAIELAACT
jgi:hypothetical protein